MRRIRILEVLGSLGRGGTEQIMYDILSRLDPNRFELEAWSIVTGWDEAERRRFEEAGIRTDAIVMDKPTPRQLLARSYRRIREQGFDIVHTHHRAANLWVRAAAILARVPIIMTYEHNLSSESWRRRALWSLLNLKTYANVTIHDMITESRRKACPRFAHKVITVINGIDLGRFKPATSEQVCEVREEFGLAAHQPVFGIVARLVDMKRVDLFLEAAALLLEKKAEVQFIVVGNGPEEANLRTQANELGIMRQVSFLGWQEEVEKAYQAMNALVVTCPEGFGLVAAEAMACGKPVISVKSIHNEVIPDDYRILVEPNDAHSIAKIMLELLDNPDVALNLGLRGRKRAEERSNITNTMHQLCSLYERAVEAKLGDFTA